MEVARWGGHDDALGAWSGLSLAHERTKKTSQLAGNHVLVRDTQLSRNPGLANPAHERDDDFERQRHGRQDRRRAREDRFAALNVEAQNGVHVVFDERGIERNLAPDVGTRFSDDATQLVVAEPSYLPDGVAELGSPPKKDEATNLVPIVTALVSFRSLWRNGTVAAFPNANGVRC